MDSINKNFPVGQPDANGNYEWMRVRAGQGISVTGDVEVNEGDLNMNGGTIRNAVFDPPIGGGGDGPIYAVNTPPLILGITGKQLLLAGATGAMVWDEIVSQPINPAGGRPYVEYIGPADIRIYEPGTYEMTLQIYGYMDIPTPTPGPNKEVDVSMIMFINGVEQTHVAINKKELILYNEEPAANILTKQDCICTKKMVVVTPAQIAINGDYARASIGRFLFAPNVPNASFTLLASGIGGAGSGYHLASIKKVADF